MPAAQSGRIGRRQVLEVRSVAVLISHGEGNEWVDNANLGLALESGRPAGTRLLFQSVPYTIMAL